MEVTLHSTDLLRAEHQNVPEKLSDLESVIGILTHGRPDHIGGSIDGKGKLAFPNARYVMWTEGWEFWPRSLTRLHATGRHQAAAYAVQEGLIRPPGDRDTQPKK